VWWPPSCEHKNVQNLDDCTGALAAKGRACTATRGRNSEVWRRGRFAGTIFHPTYYSCEVAMIRFYMTIFLATKLHCFSTRLISQNPYNKSHNLPLTDGEIHRLQFFFLLLPCKMQNTEMK